LNYRLLGGAGDDIDRILLRSIREWGFEAADRYDRLMRAVFSAVATLPALHGSREIAGVRVYPLRLGRRLVSPEQRVGRPHHLVVYRVGMDGVVEILGLAHDRMLLDRAARRMQREAKD
jgi:plasmid stabilization system protein ParE